MMKILRGMCVVVGLSLEAWDGSLTWYPWGSSRVLPISCLIHRGTSVFMPNIYCALVVVQGGIFSCRNE